jgi:hypothetical protein
VLADIIIAYGACAGSLVLHSGLLSHILHCPLAFFEATPIGRILNRFSKDLEGVDRNMPKQLGWLGKIIGEMLATVVIISVCTPAFLAVLVPLALFYHFVTGSPLKSSMPCACTNQH